MGPMTGERINVVEPETLEQSRWLFIGIRDTRKWKCICPLRKKASRQK
jgi:hypothetical protein